MAYVTDRGRAIRLADVVVVIRSRQQRARSCVILRDRSRYYTSTRPGTFCRYARESRAGLIRVGARPTRRRPAAPPRDA